MQGMRWGKKHSSCHRARPALLMGVEPSMAGSVAIGVVSSIFRRGRRTARRRDFNDGRTAGGQLRQEHELTNCRHRCALKSSALHWYGLFLLFCTITVRCTG